MWDSAVQNIRVRDGTRSIWKTFLAEERHDGSFFSFFFFFGIGGTLFSSPSSYPHLFAVGAHLQPTLAFSFFYHFLHHLCKGRSFLDTEKERCIFFYLSFLFTSFFCFGQKPFHIDDCNRLLMHSRRIEMGGGFWKEFIGRRVFRKEGGKQQWKAERGTRKTNNIHN